MKMNNGVMLGSEIVLNSLEIILSKLQSGPNLHKDFIYFKCHSGC